MSVEPFTLFRGTDWRDACRHRVRRNMEEYGLTPRQRELAWLLYCEWSLADVAEEMDISVSTVKGHLEKIAARLGVDFHDGLSVQKTVVLRLLGCEGLS